MSDGLLRQLREGCIINYDFNLVDVDEAATDTLLGKAADEIERLRAELAAERERAEAATHYATQITVWTVETFFEPDKTGWEPLTGLLGVLSQLDNAIVGVREKHNAALANVAKLREALEPILNSYIDDPRDSDAEQIFVALGDLRHARAVLEETANDA
jgi:hypothetical protein